MLVAGSKRLGEGPQGSNSPWLPGGYASEWHTASRHAYAIVLAGQMEGMIGDGTMQKLRPEDIGPAEDFTGQGHVNRVMDDQPLITACVRLDGDSGQTAQAGQ
jgi:hypothetical protein